MTTAAARTGFVFPAEKGSQQSRPIRVTKTTSTVAMAPNKFQQYVPETAIGAIEMRQAHPKETKSWSEIQRPNQFKPLPDDTQHRRNQGILADYVRRSDLRAATQLPRSAVAGSRTFHTKVVTGPNWTADGIQEQIRLTGGYADPESASSRRWSSRDARGEPVALRGDIQHMHAIEATDVLLPEARLNALELEQQNNRLFRAFARHAPSQVKPQMMAAGVRKN